MSSYLDVGGGCRKRRRRRGSERFFKLKSLSENGWPVEFDGSFRDNIKALVECGHMETILCNDGLECFDGRFSLKSINILLCMYCCLSSKKRFKRRRTTFIASIANMLVKSKFHNLHNLHSTGFGHLPCHVSMARS
ncbi:hypothetical protein V6N13_096194 [Hibiscus sabdariffa]|uniref:Uncharacterized protein n=2 Tax=Hibiscus sabdariffa TaxID=183260 RepID=A0ABR2DHF2_9ROSI